MFGALCTFLIPEPQKIGIKAALLGAAGGGLVIRCRRTAKERRQSRASFLFFGLVKADAVGLIIAAKTVQDNAIALGTVRPRINVLNIRLGLC